ncbi:FYVE RhoGEF and PH domain-containing protein 2 [Taenia crassiceps]|uniref:FYVE RhoGEF and PH domain-containing protein 2 n=1 Tax=Taenia crassiceps TaxID=6207 RepID=A0ABR4QKC4_9CEST
MISSESFALKIDLLIPDLIKREEIKKSESNAAYNIRTATAISGAIRALYLQSEAGLKQKAQISLEVEARDRVQNLLNSAKNGSFGVDEQSPAQKKIRKLENLSKELFATEKRYLETLRILKDISDKVEITESDHQDVLRDVFKEIPSLYMLHNYMDDKFYQSPSRNSVFGWWIQIFTSAELAPYFNIYKVFLSRVRTKYETLQSIYDKDKLFQQFCQSLVLTSQFTEQHMQNIPGMYIGIQSRLMRYQLLLQKIVDLLPEGVDRERCECALKIIINVLKTSEEEVTKNEMINQALLINSKLDGRRSDLDKLSLFIRSGPCLKIPRRSVGKRPLNRHLFLFSDYLIITEPETVTTGHYLVKSELTIVSMILEEPKLEDDIPVERCIRVRAVECVVELMFADADEKLSWCKSLEDTIEQERHRNNPMLNAISRRQSGVSTNKEGETPRAAEWVKDEQATMCALCYRRFTHIRRKHHCRACGKIFCGVCSNYRAKVDHQGPVEVRVCEVDFYRLNPNLKPKTATALERIAQFSNSGQRYAPYHCGFLMFTKKVRDNWPHKRTHVRMEYSAGLVSRDRSPPRPPPLTSPISSSSSENSPSLFLSIPSREMSLDFAYLGDPSSVATVSPNSPSPSGIVPLPAARLIIRPHTLRVFCVLQPDTLMALYAAKEDARSCDGIILLGTRLVYLVRVSGGETAARDNNFTASSPSPPSDRQSFGRRISSETSNCSSTDSKSVSSIPIEGNRSFEVEQSPTRKAIGETRGNSFYARVCGQKTPLAMVHSSKSEEEGEEEKEDEVAVSVTEENHKINGLPMISKVVAPVSTDTLSVLSNMNGFLILPNNTDKVGHYFEAPSEEVRNTWIQKIKSCIVDFDRS